MTVTLLDLPLDKACFYVDSLVQLGQWNLAELLPTLAKCGLLTCEDGHYLSTELNRLFAKNAKADKGWLSIHEALDLIEKGKIAPKGRSSLRANPDAPMDISHFFDQIKEMNKEVAALSRNQATCDAVIKNSQKHGRIGNVQKILDIRTKSEDRVTIFLGSEFEPGLHAPACKKLLEQFPLVGFKSSSSGILSFERQEFYKLFDLNEENAPISRSEFKRFCEDYLPRFKAEGCVSLRQFESAVAEKFGAGRVSRQRCRDALKQADMVCGRGRPTTKGRK